jgi:hypothetical protein
VFTLTLSQAVPSDEAVVIFASAGGSPGQGKAKNMKRVTVVQAATAPGLDLIDNYIEIFGAPVPGQKIFVEARLVSTTTGASRLAGSASTIVVA